MRFVNSALEASSVAFRFPPVLGVDELSLLLKKSAGTILADRCRAPHLLPPDVTPPGSKQPLWLTCDVLAWLAQFRRPTAPPPPSQAAMPRRGTSTKSERIEAHRRGITVAQLRGVEGQHAAR